MSTDLCRWTPQPRAAGVTCISAGAKARLDLSESRVQGIAEHNMIGALRAIAGLTLMAPCDGMAISAAFTSTIVHNGPGHFRSAKQGIVSTVAEHNISSGFGSGVAEVVAAVVRKALQ